MRVYTMCMGDYRDAFWSSPLRVRFDHLITPLNSQIPQVRSHQVPPVLVKVLLVAGPHNGRNTHATGLVRAQKKTLLCRQNGETHGTLKGRDDEISLKDGMAYNNHQL